MFKTSGNLSFMVLVLLLATMLLSSCSSRSKEVSNKQAALYFGSGTNSLINGHYTEALTALLKANNLEPENSNILTNLGMAYYFKGERETAVKFLNKALEFDKDNSDAKLNLASIYYNDGEIDKAEKYYKLVLKDLTYDKQARTHYNLGMLELQKRNNLVAAENYFKKAILEDDNYCAAYLQLGQIQFKRKQFRTSLKNFRESTMGTCVNSEAGHYYQGLAYIELNDFLDARLKFEEVITKFGKTAYGAKARAKSLEMNDIESRFNAKQTHASRKLLESPNF